MMLEATGTTVKVSFSAGTRRGNLFSKGSSDPVPMTKGGKLEQVCKGFEGRMCSLKNVALNTAGKSLRGSARDVMYSKAYSRDT